MSKDFILIYPPTATRALEFPIGGLHLAHSLLENSFTVGIINEYSEEEILRLLGQIGPGIPIAFGISIVSGRVMIDAISIAQHLRKSFPDTPIIWGGPHVSTHPEQTLKSSLVDFIINGEGENSLPKILKAIKSKTDFKDIRGIGYKHNEIIEITSSAEYSQLDKVFKLPYNLLNIDQYYRKLNIGGDRWLSGLYSRGCPYKCSFCINSNENWDNSSVRFHNIDHIVNDIEILINEYEADGINIMDDHFLINEKRVIKICKELLKRNLNVLYRAAGRVDSLRRMHDDTYQLLKDTGFISIGAGIESGSPRMLRVINKKITLEDVDYVDSRLSKYGIYKHWNFITALPGETIEDVRLTLKLIVKLAKTSFDSPYPFNSFVKYIPLPGTRLFKTSVERYGLKEPCRLEDWGAFSMKYELSNNDYDKSIRPWLIGELMYWTNKALSLVGELNSHYTGPNADKNKILESIENIEGFIQT